MVQRIPLSKYRRQQGSKADSNTSHESANQGKVIASRKKFLSDTDQVSRISSSEAAKIELKSLPNIQEKLIQESKSDENEYPEVINTSKDLYKKSLRHGQAYWVIPRRKKGQKWLLTKKWPTLTPPPMHKVGKGKWVWHASPGVAEVMDNNGSKSVIQSSEQSVENSLEDEPQMQNEENSKDRQDSNIWTEWIGDIQESDISSDNNENILEDTESSNDRNEFPNNDTESTELEKEETNERIDTKESLNEATEPTDVNSESQGMDNVDNGTFVDETTDSPIQDNDKISLEVSNNITDVQGSENQQKQKRKKTFTKTYFKIVGKSLSKTTKSEIQPSKIFFAVAQTPIQEHRQILILVA